MMMAFFFIIRTSDMIQTNKQYGTKRLVKRRPSFVSAADVKEKRVRYDILSMLHWAWFVCVCVCVALVQQSLIKKKNKTITSLLFVCRRPLGQSTFAPIPAHWDKSLVPTTGYKV